MATIGEIIFNVIAKTGPFSAGMGKAKRDVLGFGQATQLVSTRLKQFLGAAAIVEFGRASFVAFGESEKGINRLKFALQTAGRGLDITFGKVNSFAERMAQTTLFD